MNTGLIDGEQRRESLNPENSYIIQAPAGSGKTGLLVQRILRLLSCVDNPEEILAITFTRKAASEMRDRIIEALHKAKSNPVPEDSYKLETRELARKVLVHDQANGWRLLSNPGRLRIMTIDSLCASLVSQMPLLSKYGSMPMVEEDATELYKAAAKNTIDLLNEKSVWTHAVSSLVSHLDNRLDYTMALICNMLMKRDQWLRHVADPEHPAIDRDNLEAGFKRLVESFVSLLSDIWPQQYKQDILDLLRFSTANLQQDTKLNSFPGDSIDDLQAWKCISNLLLTNEGKLRKTVNKRQGFPAKNDADSKEDEQLFVRQKKRMIATLEIFQDYPEAISKLDAIRYLPEPGYSDDEWEIMQALFQILRIAVAQLEIVFGETGSVDFTSISQAALRALGSPEAPTDLALSLDYKVSHILVDEFQDTAWTQLALLQKLTAGWQEGDGRSLFLVGDPMQSIYRFREAEVGLFLEVWKHGIGNIKLTPLQLKVNFRSQAGIIDWINENFSKVLPVENNLETGAVRYVESEATHSKLSDEACKLYPYFEKNEWQEAEDVRQIIEKTRQQYPNDTIAILVRGRTHLASIVASLNEAGLKYRAVEIEGLSSRPVIQDLLALLKAMTQLSDTVAWLGVLRAPWCGLELNDLLKITQFDKNKIIPELLNDKLCLEQLSENGRLRLNRINQVFELSLAMYHTKNLREWLEGLWIMLGGPACLDDVTDLEDAEIFFQQLEMLDKEPIYKMQSELIKSISKIFALPDMNADESLQIMTIHKSKGLEFDTVILPGLGYRPANNDSDLIKWQERPREPDGSDLLMAPIKQTGTEANAKYQLLCDIEKQKEAYENGRLLYVATTRARKSLHIMGHVSSKMSSAAPEPGKPVSASLLHSLWPAIKGQYQQQFKLFLQDVASDQSTASDAESDIDNNKQIKRLSADWQLPEAPDSCERYGDLYMTEEELLEFDWAGETARLIGTAIHEVFHEIIRSAIDFKTNSNMAIIIDRARYSLLNAGMSYNQIETALAKVNMALKNTINDPKGLWILSTQHVEHASEYPLSGMDGNRIKHAVMDRTIVDENNARWIIDYKTGTTAGDKEVFMDREQQRYQQQLNTYATIFRHIDSRPIKLALYFPMFKGWREWEYSDEG